MKIKILILLSTLTFSLTILVANTTEVVSSETDTREISTNATNPAISVDTDSEVVMSETKLFFHDPITFRKLEGFTFETKKAFSRKHYQKQESSPLSEELRNNILTALSNKENGNIPQFEEICGKLVLNYYSTEYAAEAAYLLAEFQQYIGNSDDALAQLLFLVNLHYNSLYGKEGVLLAADVLFSKQHLNEGEELLMMIINEKSNECDCDEEKVLAKEKLGFLYSAQITAYTEKGLSSRAKQIIKKAKKIGLDLN